MRSVTGIDVPDPSPPKPATQFTRAASTGDTVTVACKLPHGLILRVFDWEEYDEPSAGGTTRRSRRARPIEGMQFIIKGTWVGSAGQAYNPRNSAVAELLPGGFALTPGVPKEIWDRWYEQNHHSALVQNKVVYAHSSHSTVITDAASLRAVKSGLEPIDPAKPAERMPGGVDRRLRMDVLTQDEGTSPR